MKEMYLAPELEIITFVPMENLASDYLGSYMRTIGGGAATKGSGASDIDIPIAGDPIY